MVDRLKGYDRDNIPPKTMEKIRKDYMSNPDFTPANAAKASSACEGMCRWIHAMDKYDEVAKVQASASAGPERQGAAPVDQVGLQPPGGSPKAASPFRGTSRVRDRDDKSPEQAGRAGRGHGPAGDAGGPAALQHQREGAARGRGRRPSWARGCNGPCGGLRPRPLESSRP